MKMIISNYSNPISGPCDVTFSATLELIKPDEIFVMNEAVSDNSAILNLEFNKQLFDFLARSCNGNTEIHLNIKNLKIEKTFPDDPRIEAVKKLTRSEYHVLKSLSEGLSYEAIAKRNNRALETIKSHVSNIFAKLNVHDRYEASGIFMKFLIKYPLFEIDRN